MNWDDLRVFLAVARAEGLSGAARALKCDAATAARRIARLEQRLGVALFARSSAGYALTEAGARLLPAAEQAEAAALQAAALVRPAETAGLTGQVRIGAPDGCANYLLPQVCAAISRDNPGLELQIMALPRVVNLTRREADLAIGVSQPQSGRLTVRKIADYHLYLAAARDFLADHPVTDLRQVRRLPMVGYIPDLIFDKELDYLGELGVSAPRLSSNSVSVQFNLLRRGAGLGIVHGFALPSAPDLVRILPQAFRLRRTFYLIRHADDARAGRLSHLADLLVGGIQAEIARLEAMLDRPPPKG